MYNLGLGPIHPRHGLSPIYGSPLIVIGPLIPFPYPINIGGNRVCLGLDGRKGRPICSRLSPGPLQLLTQIIHILVNTSDGISYRFLISLPRLSHHPLGISGLSYELLGPFPGALHLPLFLHQIIPEITLARPPLFTIPWSSDLISTLEVTILSPTDLMMSPSPLS